MTDQEEDGYRPAWWLGPNRPIYEPGTTVEELAAIKARLADNEALEWMIFEVFYANPIAFARKNLAIALQRYVLGLPLATQEEERAKYLDGLSEDERAAWWRGENARRLEVRGVVA